MTFLFSLILIAILFTISTSLVNAQQSYYGNPEAACHSNSNAAIYFGFQCNGQTSCKTNLTFRSQYPYNTVSAIASLLSVDARDIARANNLNYNTYEYNYDEVVEWNRLVYVPITCSCDSNSVYYVTFTTHTVGQGESSYFSLANSTFQGLTTCQGIQVMNHGNSLLIGTSITVPLRCACPTYDQLSNGITSVFSFVVGEGDTISSISLQLGVDSELILEANQLSQDSIIYPFTTLLIPVMDDQSTSSQKAASTATRTALSKATIGGIIAAAVAVLLGLGAAVTFRCRGTLNCCSNNLIYGLKEVDMVKIRPPGPSVV